MRYLSDKKQGLFPAHKANIYQEYSPSLPGVPQDILAEICAHLGPQELFSLSRTSRLTRLFLTSRSNAAPIWRRAFEEAAGDGSLPPVPPYLRCELQWAQLLFGDTCSICYVELSGVMGSNIWWAFNAQYCTDCFPSQFQKRLPKELEKYIPRKYWWGLFPSTRLINSETPLYSSPEIKRFVIEYLPLRDAEERNACVARQRTRTEAIIEHANACIDWYTRIPCASRNPDQSQLGGWSRDIRSTTSRRERLLRGIVRLAWYRDVRLPSSV
ncbi:hypothetical protein B0H10DRAFT_2014194 [Mycena sp. CBHHK59/15]|nr:hypothetical protein B0H10DRAFT_2014194 [Mycena sp. CBHHK59/15]